MAQSHPFELIHGGTRERRSAFQAPPALAEAIASVALDLSKQKGEIVFREGTPANGVFLLRSGKARATLFAHDGTLIIDRVLAPGALVGVPSAMCARKFQFNIDALEDCELGFVPTNILNEFLRARPDLCMDVVMMMSDELLELRQSRDHMQHCGHPECSLFDACNRCEL
jgi:CRP-like cAMP-binding protein